MGALPKRQTSKARKGRRRAHDHLNGEAIVVCSDCGSTRRPHHVCEACGRYNSVQIMNVK